MEKFCKHKKDWFKNRVNKAVLRIKSAATPSTVSIPSLEINIQSEKHAEALYVWHRDNKINFYEKTSL
jgi:hypothetical protein